MNTTAQQLDTTAIAPAVYTTITDAIRGEAQKVLESGAVAAVVGWQAGRRQGTAMPAIVTNPADADKLIFSPACVNNLALYLSKAKKEIRARGRIAIVVKGCDLKALVGLMGENQLKREDIHIIGVVCPGVRGTGDPLAKKCRECTVHTPEGADVTVGTLPELPHFTPAESEELARLEAMTPAERWSFWKEHFARCIRCYACRQICPFCYCEQCLCDRNRPQAVETTPRPAGNMAWHIVRAMHLAGRCAGCAECERVCPMDIPLNLLNRKMARELKELYGHEAGFEVREKGPLAEYRENDDQSFIK
ncbi:4Fe-4S dicluster domain-containing protein [Geobacter grbiciae]|uniref:4Fe-4S dicluster domain-containing protein n=1 Tax=Geobacter grbiciae TaxID=155042 RepID=UPI001C01DE6C|nr:4Fe-4S dicluster domain-containing protein [Geobacter grbiciae]MBT1074050.1 4Fe-4S dicluster domain-containing protein [Geobacter grbiciae]